MSNPTREVYAGGAMGYRYRARIEPAPSTFLRRPGFRFVIEKHFMGWDRHSTSRWFRDREACERAAHAVLDGYEPSKGDLLGGGR